DVDLHLAHELAALIEHLDAAVAPVGDINVALVVGGNAVRRVELSELSPSWFAVRADPVAVLVELGDARVDVPVADVDIALRIPGHVGGLAELAVDGRQR